MTRIFLYSPETLAGPGLAWLIATNFGLQLQETCSQAQEILPQVKQLEPDILLLDLTPEVNFHLLRKLKEETRCKVLLWVNEISTELAFQAMGLGIRGILRKTLPVETLVECFQKVGAGGLWFEKSLTDDMLAARKITLTRREGQLITLLSQGFKNKELAHTLGVTENTVKVYLSRLYEKLRVKDRFELALYGLRNVSAGETRFDSPVPRQPGRPRTEVKGLRSIVMDGLQNKAA